MTQFVLSAKVTADVSNFRASFGQGASDAREMGKALDATAAKAKGAEKALEGAAQAARDVGAAAGAPSSSSQSIGKPPSAKAPPPPPPPPAPPPAPPKPMALAEWQRRNLRSQYLDVATSLYNGMNPLTVLSQQGPQIVEVYGSAGAAIRGTAAALGATSLALGTVTVALAAGALAWSRYNAAREEAARALVGVGRGSGLTLDGVLLMGGRGAGLSHAEGMSVAAGYAQSGRIGGGQMAELMGITRQYARATGQDARAAGADLAQAFADPVKGADDLTRKFGMLDDKTRQLIRTMATNGDTVGAQSTLFRALASDLKQVEDRASSVSRAFEGLKTLASNAVTSAGKAIDDRMFGASPEDRLRELMAMKQQAYAEARAPRAFDSVLGPKWKRAGFASPDTYVDDTWAKRGFAEQEASLAEIARRRQQAAAEDARTQADNRSSIERGELVRGMLPDQQELERLRAVQTAAKAIRDDASKSAVAQRDAASVYERSTHALETYLAADARHRQQDALAIRSIEARTTAQRAAIAAERERLALAGSTEATAGEVERRAQAAAEAVRAQSRVDARDKLRDSRDGAALVGLSDYDRRLREIDQRWARTLEASQGDARASADNRAGRDLERAAARREATLAPMRQARQSLDEQIMGLERQKQAFDASAGAAMAFATRQQLVNEFQRAGVPITADLSAQIDRYAAAQGRVAQASDDLKRAQDRVVSGMDGIRAEARGAFSGMIDNLRQGKSVADGLLSSATRIVDRMIETRVTGPLVESLLGRDGKAGGGLFGDQMASWLGGNPALQTATISATTVIVNGQATSAAMLAGERKPLDVPHAANDGAAATPGGGSWATTGRYRGAGVDERLTDILRTAAERSGLNVQAVSGMRAGDSRFHGQGLATDVSIIDAAGKALPNYQDGSAFRAYEQFAQTARRVQMEKYPELADQFRWGGYFGGGRERYGALDTMHFDLGGGRVGMAGGSWERGLTDAQRRLWPTAYSEGMGADGFKPSFADKLPREFDALAASAERATEAASTLGTGFQTTSKALSMGTGSLETAGASVAQNAQSFVANSNGVFSTVTGGLAQVGNSFVGGLGTALQTILQAIANQGGGGFGGFFSALFGGGGNAAAASAGTAIPFALGGVMTPDGPMRLPRFAAGGVSRRTAIFGEAGPEAAVPLPDGRSIPVSLKLSGMAATDNAATSLPLTALAGAIGRLNDRLAAANAPREPLSSGPDVVIENRADVSIRRQDEAKPGGGRRQRVVIDGMMADAAGRPGSRTLAAMQAAQTVGRR